MTGQLNRPQTGCEVSLILYVPAKCIACISASKGSMLAVVIFVFNTRRFSPFGCWDQPLLDTWEIFFVLESAPRVHEIRSTKLQSCRRIRLSCSQCAHGVKLLIEFVIRRRSPDPENDGNVTRQWYVVVPCPLRTSLAEMPFVNKHDLPIAGRHRRTTLSYQAS